MPARGAIAEPPMPIMWMCFIFVFGVSCSETKVPACQKAARGRYKAKPTLPKCLDRSATQKVRSKDRHLQLTPKHEERRPTLIAPQPALTWTIALRQLPKDEHGPREEQSAWAVPCDHTPPQRPSGRRGGATFFAPHRARLGCPSPKARNPGIRRE